MTCNYRCFNSWLPWLAWEDRADEIDLLQAESWIPCPACNPAAMSYGDDVVLPWLAVEVGTPC